MNIYEFGKENEKKLVMIHGACMSWDMFMDSIEILKDRYHVYAVGVPGHDIAVAEEFTSVEEISSRIEDKLIECGAEKVDLIYGLSMGGGFVIRILADNRLSVKHAIIDAGITPYEMPYIFTRFILLKDFLMTEWGKHSYKALALAFPPERYTEQGVRYMYTVMRYMSARTIRNVFDSTDNYSMPAHFPEIDTTIDYWYGEAEKRARKLDIAYVKKHIPHASFREIKDMDHGQYALMYPQEFANDLTRILD